MEQSDVYSLMLSEVSEEIKSTTDSGKQVPMVAPILIPPVQISSESAVAAIRNVKVPAAAPKRQKPTTQLPSYCDLMENLTEFTSPLYTGETYGVVTLPTATTCTLNGNLSGVRFHEKDLIEKVQLNDSIAMLVCNFGKKVQPWYEEVLKQRPKRKPVLKSTNGHPRKIQGSGECFNSQITFITAHNDRKHFFKVKVFRTGFLQIPGSRPELVGYSFEAIGIVLDELARALTIPRDTVKLEKLYLVMKDYKLHAPMFRDQSLDLYALKTIFGIIKLRQISPTLPDEDIVSNIETIVGCPKTLKYKQLAHSILERTAKLPSPDSLPIITDLRYNFYENKFSATFSTPIPDDPNKHIRLVIFPDGYLDKTDQSKGYGCKVDILGAIDRISTLSIYMALMTILRDFRDLVVIDVQSRRRQKTSLTHFTGKKKSRVDRVMDRIIRQCPYENTVEFPPLAKFDAALQELNRQLIEEARIADKQL